MQSSLSIPFQITHGCLVAALHGMIDDNSLAGFQQRILEEVKVTHVKGVVLDMSQVSVLDDVTFSHLTRIANALVMLGSRVVFCGFQPAVVAALVHFDADTADVEAFFNLENALDRLNEEFMESEQRLDAMVDSESQATESDTAVDASDEGNAS